MYKVIGQDSDGVRQAAVLTLGEALASAAEMIESGGVNVEIECPDGRIYNEAAILDMVRGCAMPTGFKGERRPADEIATPASARFT